MTADFSQLLSLCEKLGRDGVAHACGPKYPEKGDIMPEEEDSVLTASGEDRDHQEGNNQEKKVLQASCSFVKSKKIYISRKNFLRIP